MSERSNREFHSLWHRAGHLGERALSDDRLMSRLIRGSNRQVQMANLLGAYDPTARRITVYSKIVEWAARAISVDARALANVAFLHEAVRALCHVGRDLDGKMWEDFGQVPSDNISFRPSLIVETFAQYFSFRLLERLEDANMMTAFERLNDNQPAEYQAWNRMRRVPIEEMRKLLLRTRAGLNDQFAEIR